MNPALLFRLISEKLAAEYHRMQQFEKTSLSLTDLTDLHEELVKLNSMIDYCPNPTDMDYALRHFVLLRRFMSGK